MSSTTSTSARTASMRVTKQEYEALQSEAQRQGYKLSHLMRHRIFGKQNRCADKLPNASDKTNRTQMIDQFSFLGEELVKNGTHIRLIANSLDEGFRDAFGLDFCLRLLERLGDELLKALAIIQTNGGKTRDDGHASHEHAL